MFRSSSYLISFLLSTSLTATPLYAEDSRSFDRQPSFDVMADNDKREAKEEERHNRAEERENRRHEKKESKIKDRQERKSQKKSKAHKEGHISGAQTAPQPSGNTAHVSGAPSSSHISGK